MTKKALITGITGQDGAYLARLLIDKGYTVVGTSRDAQMAHFQGLDALGIRDSVRIESMALNDFRSVLQVLRKVVPDEIYNLAGQSSVSLSFELPLETLESVSVGTLNLLEAIRFMERPIRIYNAGSSECFGNTGAVPADEETPFRPRSRLRGREGRSVLAGRQLPAGVRAVRLLQHPVQPRVTLASGALRDSEDRCRGAAHRRRK